MRLLQFIACVLVVALLIWVNQATADEATVKYGGLTVFGWLSLVLAGAFFGLFMIARDTARAFGFFRRRDADAKPPVSVRTLSGEELRELGLAKFRGPSYPHPVIFPDRCIGCQACVDACPHDVLAIVDGVAAAVAPDLCMEDTACQAECPVNPKACIVINTTKEVRSLPTPTRDGATYQTNVPGVYIIGDVSGVPLIKNAVKEGAEVVKIIASDLASARFEPNADYDVAIVGVGPGGASAAVTASDAGLRYVAIEQDRVLSTIQLYPKGKYIFFKPDTKSWDGGIPVAGLGLGKSKYNSADDDGAGGIINALDGEHRHFVQKCISAVTDKVAPLIPRDLRVESAPLLRAKIEKEIDRLTAEFLQAKGGDLGSVYRKEFLPNANEHGERFAAEIADLLAAGIPGDQRENILDVWIATLNEKGVQVNENESCKSVTKAGDGDYFVITTERGTEKAERTYRARRVVLAIGLRGAPNKLRLPNEEMRAVIDGVEQPKVMYGLSNPMEFRGKNIVVVGGGNVAVEAAVDLVAVRDGANIRPRNPDDMNRVTVLVREHLAPTVKFGNKLQLYTCAEDGLLDLKFGAGIKEMRGNEVVLENVKTKEVVATIPNDFVFALIGGERPNRFLESIGITIE